MSEFPAAYRRSLTFAGGEKAGSLVSTAAVRLVAVLDRWLEASLVGRMYAALARIGNAYAEGSLFMNWLWPYAKLAIVPWGEKVGVETALGVLLALACVAPTEILMVVALGVFVLFVWDRARKVRRGEETRLWALPGFGMVTAVAAVLLFTIGATVSSVVPSKSLFNMLIWFFYFLVFFMAADASARGRGVHVAWPFMTGAALSGLVSIYQRLTGWRPPKNWVDVAFEGELTRYVGTFTNPVFFAEMMGLALPIAMALILINKDWRDRLALLGFAGLQGIGLLLSGSRGAWLGFAISFCILAVFYDWRMLPLGLLAGGVGLALAPDVLLKRLLSSFSLTDSSNSYRVFIWRGSIAMLKDHLIRGVGLGAEAYARVYPEYMIVQTPAPHAHSTFIQYLIEVGLFGFLSMAYLFAIWLYDGFRAIFAEKERAGRWAKIGLLAACIASVGGHLLEGVIDYTWYSPKITVAFWAVVGIASGIACARMYHQPAVKGGRS
ncbi:MAG: O-antigen ligase family protein [Bacillota bacterium]